ncbi:hypothetical protein DL764_004585 [Monosporascus ibericus]|uniref:UDENN FLCN/SMCR8-type domain-containing protein n=1 Tax=Monosporascus ibericus TaxID=155417 RepID=A0A4Q4TC34_9PEZI|nr:hypothetical protein DL764_004585 [Monosporascus ibericus]
MVVTQKPAAFPLLTSEIKLCLAHYCDMHGPTPLMVTEGLPVPCGRCYDDMSISERSQTTVPNGSQPSVTDALRKLTLNAPRSSSLPQSEQDAQTRGAIPLQKPKKQATTPAAQESAVAPSAIETPPHSPNRPPERVSETNNTKSSNRHDSSFRRTYDEYVTKRANPCQNCALTLPKRQEGKPANDKNTTATDTKSDVRGPTLRTRAPYARVYGSHDGLSPPHSNPESSCTSDAEDDVSLKDTIRPSNHHRRPTTSTSRSSFSSRSSLAQHTHYLDYTSTHEPLVPTTYSIVRASCLRTLSFETLPRRPENAQTGSTLSSPTSTAPPSFPSPPIASYNPSSTGYITAAPTPQSAANNGGPIFFGDPLAGYTTAYIFRIPDMHARGRKRVYAFLALSTHRERLAMKTFSFVSAAFRDLAAWIQELAEAEAEREREREEEAGSAVAALNAAYGNGGFGGGGPRDSGVGLGLGGGSIERDRDRGSESSFLTSGGRGQGFIHRMGGSMGPGGFAPKARGLAELVGLPDFFIELHTRFVRILLELGVVLGS